MQKNIQAILFSGAALLTPCKPPPLPELVFFCCCCFHVVPDVSAVLAFCFHAIHGVSDSAAVLAGIKCICDGEKRRQRISMGCWTSHSLLIISPFYDITWFMRGAHLQGWTYEGCSASVPLPHSLSLSLTHKQRNVCAHALGTPAVCNESSTCHLAIVMCKISSLALTIK